MMTKTSWSRFSKLALACLLVLSTAAVPAAAVSVDDASVTSDAEVGSEVTATATLTQLYQNPSLEAWTLRGSTEMTNVTWTVVFYDQTGSQVGQQSYDGQTFSSDQIAAADGTNEVEVRVTGTVPAIEEFTYDPAPSFTVMKLVQAREGGSSNPIKNWSATHYTQESREARNAIEKARAEIEQVNSQAAEQRLQNAIEAYNGEEFALAIDLATQAAKQAQEAQRSKQLTQLALYGVGALVVLGLLVGGFLYWRSQQSGPDKLG